MLLRKPKTRIERTQSNLVKLSKQAQDTRKDFIKQLQRTARHLRTDMELLLEGEERTRANRMAKELEHMAEDVEKRAGERLGEVYQVARGNIWKSLLITFVLGLLVGLLVKILKDS